MANQLDLEEQEQLDQLKHFWNTWGTLISSVLVVVFGALAVWNGYQFWQNRQATQASALFDAVEVAVQTGDQTRVEQAFGDIRGKYAGTVQAAQAGLLVAKLEMEKNQPDAAKAALEWTAKNASDEGYRAIARLRLASVLLEQKAYDAALQTLSEKFPLDLEQKAYDAALQTLSEKFPLEMHAVVADRKGDVLLLQGKNTEAAAEYSSAYAAFSDSVEYRRLVEVKLNALGIKPAVQVATSMAEVKK